MRNTQQLNNRLLAACEQPMAKPAVAVTSLEDLMREERVVTQKKVNQLPVRYGKVMNLTENTMTTAPTSTSIVLPTNSSIQTRLQPINRVSNSQQFVEVSRLVQQVSNTSEVVSNVRGASPTIQQYRSVSPNRPVASSRSPTIVRLQSPPPAGQVVKFNYSSPNAQQKQPSAQQNIPIQRVVSPPPQPCTNNSLQEARLIRQPQTQKRSTEMEQPPHQNTSAAQFSNMTFKSPPKTNEISSPRILELNLKSKQNPFPMGLSPSNGTHNRETSKPQQPSVINMANPFKNDSIDQPSQSKEALLSPFEVSPQRQATSPSKPVIIEKSSINHLDSIFSSGFLRTEQQHSGKESKPKGKPPKPIKRSSIAVGTSMHFQHIDDLELKCRNYEKELDSIRASVPQKSHEKQPMDYTYADYHKQESYNYEPMYKKPGSTEHISTGANSKSSTVLSPFELSSMLQEEQPEHTSDSLYFKELRLERILRKYRSKQDTFQFDYQ